MIKMEHSLAKTTLSIPSNPRTPGWCAKNWKIQHYTCLLHGHLIYGRPILSQAKRPKNVSFSYAGSANKMEVIISAARGRDLASMTLYVRLINQAISLFLVSWFLKLFLGSPTRRIRCPIPTDSSRNCSAMSWSRSSSTTTSRPEYFFIT